MFISAEKTLQIKTPGSKYKTKDINSRQLELSSNKKETIISQFINKIPEDTQEDNTKNPKAGYSSCKKNKAEELLLGQAQKKEETILSR